MKPEINQSELNKELSTRVANILVRQHAIEFALYMKAMALIVSLQKRYPGRHLSVQLIRHSLSSLKIERLMAGQLLRIFQECGFLIYAPRQGYQVKGILGKSCDLPYSPSRRDITI